MKKWSSLLSGKKVMALGLAALVALTALLAIAFYQTGRKGDKTAVAEGSQEQTQEEGLAVAAGDISHEIPAGSEVGEQILVDEQESVPMQTNPQQAAAADTQENLQANQEESGNTGEDVREVAAGNSQLVSMNLNFDGTAKLQWPVAGRELIKEYSMDSLVYYATLDVYKVSPAVMVQASVGDAVMAPADAVVTEIGSNEEIGSFVRLKLGDTYEAVVGNLSDIKVNVGDYLVKGSLLGGVAAPTKYYVTEGPNVYFELLCGNEPVDPLDYLD